MTSSLNALDLDGQAVDLLAKYKGKNLLVILYNNDCLGCTGRAIPLAYDFQQMYPALQVIGIHSDFLNREGNKENIKAVFTSGEIPFPIYIDRNHQIYDQYEAEGTPQWLFFTPTGELFHSVFGSQDGAQNRLAYTLEEMLAV